MTNIINTLQRQGWIPFHERLDSSGWIPIGFIHNSPAKGMFYWATIGTCCAMSAENPFENDFFFPRVQKKHALREQNQAHKRFRMMISKEEQRAFGDLLQRTN
jgi:hypothetical protein